MDFSDIPNMLKEVSRLLVMAEHSPNPQERADALMWLRAIRAKLKDELEEVESTLIPGMNRKVEAASLRSAITTLESELRTLEAIEASRPAKLAQQKPTG